MLLHDDSCRSKWCRLSKLTQTDILPLPLHLSIIRGEKCGGIVLLHQHLAIYSLCHVGNICIESCVWTASLK